MSNNEVTEQQRARIAAFIEDRVLELGIDWKDIPERGGPSTAKVREFVRGRSRVLNASKRRELEHALEWVYGSIGDIAAGLKPTPVQEAPLPDDELASRYFHPSNRPRVTQFLAGNADIAAVLERLVVTGQVDDTDRERLERALEDMRIEGFPAAFEKLSRAGKLRVVDFGGRVQVEEHLAKEANNELEATTKSPASAEAVKDEEAASLDEPQRERLDDVSKLIIASAADVNQRNDGGQESG